MITSLVGLAALLPFAGYIADAVSARKPKLAFIYLGCFFLLCGLAIALLKIMGMYFVCMVPLLIVILVLGRNYKNRQIMHKKKRP